VIVRQLLLALIGWSPAARHFAVQSSTNQNQAFGRGWSQRANRCCRSQLFRT